MTARPSGRDWPCQEPHRDACLQGLSIACSTPEAIAWDESWADTHEISGRAMQAVHESGSDFNLADKATPNGVPNGIHPVMT